MNRNSIIILLILTFFMISCSAKKKDNTNNTNNTGTTTENTSSTTTDHGLEKRYLKEGFVAKDTYRVVIVATKEDCDKNEDDIKSKAQKRALVSLQKLISSQGKRVGRNTKAGLLSLISNSGNFTKKNDGCKRFNIFYYDIKKRHIKRQIKRIASRD